MGTVAAADAVVVCLCAGPDAAVAARIARALVDGRLAACVNVLPGMRSVYRWREAVEEADEVLLLAKTTRAALPALQARLVALHPYELPELLAVEAVDGLPACLGWIADNVAAAPRAHDSGE
jgi:periplasmic divalent cation tolerance protein